MATYRQIYISFWSDTKVCDDFSPEDKYFYIYLLTNPHTNICGCYEISSSQMAQELGYHTFFWSLAYVDWYQDKQPSKEEAFEKLLGRIHPGAIVLLHSTSDTNGAILDELLTNGKKWDIISPH